MKKAKSCHRISVFGRRNYCNDIQLVNIYRKAEHDLSTVRIWITRFNTNPREKGKTDLCDRLHCSSGMRIKQADIQIFI